MALDPLVKAFLDQAAAIPRPKAWEMPLGAMRKSFAGMMGLVGPKDVPVGKIENFKIPGPQGDIRARAYSPIAVGGTWLQPNQAVAAGPAPGSGQVPNYLRPAARVIQRG